jgi:hypothetical protein
MPDIDTVAEVMMNCWDEPFEVARKQVVEYYADGATYNMETAEWEWPFFGPRECVEVALENACIHLPAQQITALANALVDLGADFTIEPPECPHNCDKAVCRGDGRYINGEWVPNA